MSKRAYLYAGTIVASVAILAIVYSSSAQTKSSSPNRASPIPAPIKMSIHGYTGYPDDLEHCFVQDSGTSKRPLYFDAYIDVAVQESQINLEVYTFKDGAPTPIRMIKDTPTSPGDWYVKNISSNMFTIEIHKDDKDRQHLGPGPYMAAISISDSAALSNSVSKHRAYYPYGTWLQSSSPLDCWYPRY